MATLQKIAAVIVSIATAFATLVGHFGMETKPAEYEEYKNVIVMIGDGMGFNTIEATKKVYGIEELEMEKGAVVNAQSETDALLGILTDSAAGGTALACGIRTIPGMVGTYAFDPLGAISTPMNLSEAAISLGKSAGVVTTDSTTGATPSAFSAHATSRSDEANIAKQQLASDLDLIWGADTDSANAENVAAAGKAYVTNADELAALDGTTASYAEFNFDDLKYVKNDYNTPTLDVMTEKAIELLDDNENGFFLMVEGACIDKHSHSNDLENATKSVVEFDKAVAVALSYAEEMGDTLVIVTADHETGGIQYDAATDSYIYTSGSHTDANVPVFVNVDDAGFVLNAIYENRHIGAQLGLVLGMETDAFPGTSKK